jgi:hypothetical protein
MKKVTIYIVAAAMLLYLSTSCKDVLDQQSPDSYTEDVVFSDINVVKSFVGKCYDRMGGNTDAGILGMREDLLSSATDQTLCIHRPANYVNLKGTMSPDMMGYFESTGYGGFLRWGEVYSDIQNVNKVIAKIDDVVTKTTTEDALKTRLKGEAYFIRAYLYSSLMMNFGGVVLVTEPNVLGGDFLKFTRSTLAETETLILSDITAAIANLPATMEQGRATRGAAAALKSRITLFCASKLTNGGWTAQASNALVSFTSGTQISRLQAARDAAKDVMNGTYGTYALAGTTTDPVLPLSAAQIQAYSDNYFKIFNQKAGAWNSETIWGIQYPITAGNVNNMNLWSGPNGYHNWGNNDPTEPAVRSFEMADGTPFVWDKYTPGDQVLRTATAAELTADPLRSPYNGREPRFYACVLYHGAPWQDRPADAAKYDPYNKIQTGSFYNDADGTVKAFGVDTRSGSIENWNGEKTGYNIKKFLDPATVGQYYRNTNAFIEFRYAEILLNYAEACIELGGADLQPGLDALNLVRNRAGLPDRVTTDQAQARTWLRHEREIEFFAEQNRYYDLRRWMAYGDVVQNVYGMKVKEFVNTAGVMTKMEWKLDLNDNEDTRSWKGDYFYWLPIITTEMKKAPQLVQNPGY